MIDKSKHRMKQNGVADSSRIVGDGVHDDTIGIQALLDQGTGTVYLPPPPKYYLISRTLIIHSQQALRLDPYTTIRLAAGSNTVMLTNDDHTNGNETICVTGGIWDMDNQHQSPNPFVQMGNKALTTPYDPSRFVGALMRMNHVRNLTLDGLTLRDPTVFGVQLGNLYQFTIRNITFDYQHVNPVEVCMDGIHINGNSRYGYISNLKGMTHDDMVALCAEDGMMAEMVRGPIEDIVVNGLFSEDGFTAVRFLSAGSPVRRISLSNVRGTYRYNVASFSNLGLHMDEPGLIEDIAIRDIRCAKSRRGMDDGVPSETAWEGYTQAAPDWHGFAPLFIFGSTLVRNLTLDDYSRVEALQATSDIHVEPKATVDGFAVRNCHVINRTPDPVVFLKNRGTIRHLTMKQVSLRAEEGPSRGSIIHNNGTIDQAHTEGLIGENLASLTEGI